MNIKKVSRPTKCKLCLQDADEEIQRHIRENRPCTQLGCPLQKEINAALERKRNQRKIVFGTPKKQSIYQNRAKSVKYSEMSNTKKSKFKKHVDYIINHFKKLKKL